VPNFQNFSVKGNNNVLRSSRQTIPYADCVILFLLPSIINITVVPELHVSRPIVSLLFISLLLKNVFLYSAISGEWGARVSKAFSLTFSKKNITLIFLMTLVALYTLANVRAGYLGLLSPISYVGSFVWTLAILLYLLSVVSLNDSKSSRGMLIVSLVCGLGFFIAVNVISHMAGMRGFNSIEDVGQNKILSLIGIQAQRARLPFTSGVNNFGAMSGLVAVVGFALVRSSRGFPLFAIGSIVAALGFVGGILVDSRGSLGIALVVCVILLILTSKTRWKIGIGFLPLLVLVAPIIIYAASYIISNTGLAKFFVRDGALAHRLGVLTGRDFVWESAFRILSEPIPMHLIGYGTFGQVTSGAIKGYAWIFLELPALARQSLHNNNIQVIFDIGYIGLFIWVSFCMALMRDLCIDWNHRKHSFEAVVPMAMACCIFLGGIIEVGGSPYYPDIFVLLMFITAWSMPFLTRPKSTGLPSGIETVEYPPAKKS